jgi:hypothetical protein
MVREGSPVRGRRPDSIEAGRDMRAGMTADSARAAPSTKLAVGG